MIFSSYHGYVSTVSSFPLTPCLLLCSKAARFDSSVSRRTGPRLGCSSLYKLLYAKSQCLSVSTVCWDIWLRKFRISLSLSAALLPSILSQHSLTSTLFGPQHINTELRGRHRAGTNSWKRDIVDRDDKTGNIKKENIWKWSHESEMEIPQGYENPISSGPEGLE